MSHRFVLAAMAAALLVLACRGAVELGDPSEVQPALAAELAWLRDSEYVGLTAFLDALVGARIDLELHDGETHARAHACGSLWAVGMSLTLTRADGAKSDFTIIEYSSITDRDRAWEEVDGQLEPVSRAGCIDSLWFHRYFGSAVENEKLVLMFHGRQQFDHPRSEGFDAGLVALFATIKTDR